MEKKDLKKKYNLKIKELLKHNKLYYEKSKPIITDADYDKLKNQIKELEKNNKFLNTKNSPINNVGYKPSKLFEKYKHKVPMLSLSNAFYDEDLINFEKNFQLFKKIDINYMLAKNRWSFSFINLY